MKNYLFVLLILVSTSLISKQRTYKNKFVSTKVQKPYLKPLDIEKRTEKLVARKKYLMARKKYFEKLKSETISYPFVGTAVGGTLIIYIYAITFFEIFPIEWFKPLYYTSVCVGGISGLFLGVINYLYAQAKLEEINTEITASDY